MFPFKSHLQRERFGQALTLCQMKRSSPLLSAKFYSSSSTKDNSTNLDAVHDRLTPKEWNTALELPEPSLDWSFLLDEGNEVAISTNIEHRKGIGNIQKMVCSIIEDQIRMILYLFLLL